MLLGILDDVWELDPPPRALTCQRAREELLATEVSYARSDESHVGDRAPMVLEIFSLLAAVSSPVRMSRMLGGPTRWALTNFEEEMYTGADVWAQRAELASACTPTPP